MNITEATPIWFHDLARYAETTGVELIGRGDPKYELVRHVFNRFHDLYPAALVRTNHPNSIATILRYASDHDIPLAIRGGGHHIAGYGSCEGGIVIDFSPFRMVEVNSVTGIAEVQPGARLGDVDRELCPKGLVIPTGTVSETGIAGLTLGGGIGWLVGRYGLTCDHLVGADVVLADGRLVRAEDEGHNDLLWALRGGGGNFGVVTHFRYQTHTLPPCTVGSASVALENASTALKSTVDFLALVNERNLTVAPILTRNKAGKPILSIDFCLASDNDKVLRPFENAVGPADWAIHPNADYAIWQSSFDQVFQAPMRGYWKARYSRDLTSLDIETLIDVFASAPTGETSILIEHLHGAFCDKGIDSAVFPLRWARFGILLSARWTDPAIDSKCISWVRQSFDRLDPMGTSSTYSNYTAHDDPRAISTLNVGDAQRLAAVKKRYDPQNLFRRNHNIRLDASATKGIRASQSQP